MCEEQWRATVAVLAVVAALKLSFQITSLLAMVFWFFGWVTMLSTIRRDVGSW